MRWLVNARLLAFAAVAAAVFFAGCSAQPTPYDDTEDPDVANLITYSISVLNNGTQSAVASLVIRDPVAKQELLNETAKLSPGVAMEREFAGNYTREYSLLILDAATKEGIAYTTSANICYSAVKYRFELIEGSVKSRGSFCQDAWSAG